MHIGIEGHGFWGEGGSQTRYAYQLIRALARIDRTNRYTIFFNSSRQRLGGLAWFRDFLQNDNFSYVVTRVPNTASPWLKRLRRDLLWPWLGRRVGIELFHSTAQRAMYAADIPSVLTVHDLAGLVHPEWFRMTRLSHKQNRTVMRDLRRASVVLASSHNTQEDIYRLVDVPHQHVRVVLLGIDTTQFHPLEDTARLAQVKQKYGIDGSYLLHVGDLVPRKNLERLLRVYARLKSDDRIPHQLVLAGKLNYGSPQLLQLPKMLGIASDVKFPGYVPEAVLPILYAGATLFVYPSLYEGFGLPLLEAMACGVPVVCSRNSSLVEVVGDAAVILEATDEEGWYHTLKMLLQDEERRWELQRRGLVHVKQFSWDRTAGQTLAIYREFGAV